MIDDEISFCQIVGGFFYWISDGQNCRVAQSAWGFDFKLCLQSSNVSIYALDGGRGITVKDVPNHSTFMKNRSVF